MRHPLDAVPPARRRLAFVALGWPVMRALPKEGSGLTKAAFASVSWLFLNWWMHGNMHVHNGFDVWGLITIDYAFHLTIIVATAILQCVSMAKERRQIFVHSSLN